MSNEVKSQHENGECDCGKMGPDGESVICYEMRISYARKHHAEKSKQRREAYRVRRERKSTPSPIAQKRNEDNKEKWDWTGAINRMKEWREAREGTNE